MDAKLVMFKNDGQRKDFPVTGPTVSVGRGEDCDLRVPLLSVSRRHCELTVTGEEMKVRDLGSSNGTYLNNNRISEEVTLKAGDRLAVGPVIFTVQIDGKPEDIQPVKMKDHEEAEELEVEEEAEVVDVDDVDVAATVSTEGGEAVTMVPHEKEQVQEKAEVEADIDAEIEAEIEAKVEAEEKAEVKAEAKVEEKAEEEEELEELVEGDEGVALETIADAGEEEDIDPISALEALANKRGKPKPPSG